MPTLSRSALVMHSVEQMYQLVNDVESYPKFLPDCSDSRLISHQGNEMTASLLVAKGGLKKWFTTKNVLTPNKQVLLHLVDGPFKQLTGTWQFTALSDHACKISLQLEYEFASKVFDLAFGRVFNQLANNMVQAFTLRAKNIYGADVE
jgi:ribosome-associated toxin RatA of RatAB toxin-antitoxin module